MIPMVENVFLDDPNWNMPPILRYIEPTVLSAAVEDQHATLKIKFNSTRQYTAEGQIIFAEMCGETVHFVDTARGIDGTFSISSEIDASELMWLVMYAYDFHQYVSDWGAKKYAKKVAMWKEARQ